ncbi:hypothetical protein MCELHM10_03287 [Paracoccaceae bacterium]
MRKFFLASVLAMPLAGAAFGQGCALTGGTSAPEVEAFNQMVMDQKFDDFAAAMEARANMDVNGAMKSVAEAYATGFSSCTTLAQRQDTGGLTQQVVMFRSEVGPLFIYWLYADVGAEFTLLQFKMDSDLDVLENLR